MHNLLLRTIALLTAFAVAVQAQSVEPDGTLLSPNMPLPIAFGLQPSFVKVAQTAPKGNTPMASKSPRQATPSNSALTTVKEDGGLTLAKTSALHRSNGAPKTSANVNAKTSSVTKTPLKAPVKAPVVAKKPVVKSASASVVRSTSSRGLASLTVRSTAYNSHVSQTDRTPFVTATGARTRFGVVALSRDLLRRIPYGSILRIEDMGGYGSGRGRGAFNRMLSGVSFIVEDTMHPRKVNTVDVWMASRRTALQWGKRQIRITVLRYGRR
jgi:3D (Asp-Asp-Asp) domain-containing protein